MTSIITTIVTALSPPLSPSSVFALSPSSSSATTSKPKSILSYKIPSLNLTVTL
eukprot:UN20130